MNYKALYQAYPAAVSPREQAITRDLNMLGSLPVLEELALNNNHLQEFPEVLLTIKSLKRLYIGSNPLFGREALQSPYASQIKQLEANNTQVTY